MTRYPPVDFMVLVQPCGSRHDLRLIREDLATLRIHENLQPLDVVVAVRLVVAESFDACETLDATTIEILERFVDADVVRVTVHVCDWLAERDDLVAQRSEKIVSIGEFSWSRLSTSRGTRGYKALG